MAAIDGWVTPAKVRFGEMVATMSPRDRKLFVGLIVVVLASVLAGAGWLGRGYLADLRSRVADHEQSLALLQGMAGDYATAAKDIARIEDKLKQSAGQDLSSYTEKAAQKTGISANLKGVRERGVHQDGNLEAKTYGVDLDRVTLQQYVDFLHEIETGGFPLRIQSARIKSSGPAGQKLLAVSMEIAAYRLVDVAPEATP